MFLVSDSPDASLVVSSLLPLASFSDVVEDPVLINVEAQADL